jgi:hypothetical protein
MRYFWLLVIGIGAIGSGGCHKESPGGFSGTWRLYKTTDGDLTYHEFVLPADSLVILRLSGVRYEKRVSGKLVLSGNVGPDTTQSQGGLPGSRILLESYLYGGYAAPGLIDAQGQLNIAIGCLGCSEIYKRDR